MDDPIFVCLRCGFETPTGPPRLEDWPLETPPPPLPAWANPHPVDACCSPFTLGQTLYWDLGGQLPDLPPALVVFQGLAEILGPCFTLEEEGWVLDTPAIPHTAKVELHPRCPLTHLLQASEEELAPVEVPITQLTKRREWPAWGRRRGPRKPRGSG